MPQDKASKLDDVFNKIWDVQSGLGQDHPAYEQLERAKQAVKDAKERLANK